MISFLKNIFSGRQKVKISELIVNDAIIIDVRTNREFQSGHLKKSMNIPLDKLPANLSKLDKSKPIITCCATGMRSATAKRILESNGFSEVYNGGSWTNLRKFEN
jgi:phage shock protein E